MSEIEKMYENANIKQDRMCEWTCKDSETCNLNCKHYGSMQLYYPPFTAEKQIELIKLLTQQCDLTISHFTKWEFIHFDGQEPTQVKGKDFVETFAKLINAYWQSLTDQEKEEIRRILNE